MWTLPIHFSGPVYGVTVLLVVLGVSARSVFRYPHMWRYMELRLRILRGRPSEKASQASGTSHHRCDCRRKPITRPSHHRRKKEDFSEVRP
jgi:hypothetical protein